MTIGPEPIRQTERMSRRFGKPHLLDPGREQWPRVVRARARLGMELHRAGSKLREVEPLDGAVVERNVRGFLRGRGSDRKAVVLARDEDAVRALVEHRVVRAAVAERELER